MNISMIGVVGAGQMGSGIAQVAAMGGLKVVLQDISAQYVEQGLDTIAKNLTKKVGQKKISEDEKNKIIENIALTTEISEMNEVDFAIEAVSEQEIIKFSVFNELDRVCPPRAILATNTSSIPIGRIAARTKRPDKIIGMHFMNPVPAMQLIEIIRALPTSDETYETTIKLAEFLGKKPAPSGDFPGFIANRILFPMINEAVFCLYQGVGDREAIDRVMKLGMNHPMGPLTLADFIGLDTCLAILETLYSGLGDPKYRPCPLLRQYVESGWLGCKTGRGFYSYEDA